MPRNLFAIVIAGVIGIVTLTGQVLSQDAGEMKPGAAFAAPRAAQDAPPRDATAGKPPTETVRVADLGWFTGDWQCDVHGTPVREHWDRPQGGVMFGACRIGAQRERCLFEVLIIEEREDGVYLCLKHFGPGLTSKISEAPLHFKLARSGPKELVFENPEHQRHQRIVYKLEGDALVCRLGNIDAADAKPPEEFRMQRVK